MDRLQLGGSEEVSAFVAAVIGRSRCSWNGASLLDADSLSLCYTFIYFLRIFDNMRMQMVFTDFQMFGRPHKVKRI